MRRKDREITDLERVLTIIDTCDCCRLGLVDGEEAYIVPMNFGYEQRDDGFDLYFHCAGIGRKMELIPRQKAVAFEMDTGHALKEGKIGCDFSYYYQCVMGKGEIQTLKDLNEKLHGLQKIMEHYTGKQIWGFAPEAMDKIKVLKLTVSEWSCKAH